jgi:flagellar assembly factor FliW
VKSEILGFKEMSEVEFREVDELFASLKDPNNPHIAFTLVNPFVLREYVFNIPSYVEALLEVNENSKLLIYNVAVLQTPIEETKVNFLAPIIMNPENGTLAQAILRREAYPDFGMAEAIGDYLKDS